MENVTASEKLKHILTYGPPIQILGIVVTQVKLKSTSTQKCMQNVHSPNDNRPQTGKSISTNR
jgi:hypothetical protein